MVSRFVFCLILFTRHATPPTDLVLFDQGTVEIIYRIILHAWITVWKLRLTVVSP